MTHSSRSHRKSRAGRARGGRHPVAAMEALAARKGGQVGLDLGQRDRRVGHQLVEVLDGHGLGQHRQLAEGWSVRPAWKRR